MVKRSTMLFYALQCFFVLSVLRIQAEDKLEYIVYMGALPDIENYVPTAEQLSVLQDVTGQSSVEDRLLRSYKKSFNGFAAKLTRSEVERMASTKGVVSVFPNKKMRLQTTASWDFMGLVENSTKRVPSVESNIIIGVIDSGIWPESESFNDKGFGPPPKKWKGACKGGSNFTCNNKIIGARFYVGDSAIDAALHGTHTASTAAGSYVPNASMDGIGLGTARGAVPSARIAAYRVCGDEQCSNDAVLAAFDDAIADGVDIISLSIGNNNAVPFGEDSLSLGSFHAASKGILTVMAAGNSHPVYMTDSVAPWLFTVGASTTNRRFETKVVLGNGKTFVGSSLNKFDMNGTMYPMVYGKSTTSTCDEKSARLCKENCLDEKLVKGKIVLCDFPRGIGESKKVGAIGTISVTEVWEAFDVPLAATTLFHEDYQTIVSYVTSTEDPKASILKTERVMHKTEPVIASFTSHGPNLITPDILKPDVTAPGVEILAAYSPDDPYYVLSGTSMSCPHVSGIAAYVKTFHPDWSHSMIKSAIMTTTWPMNSTINSGAEFGYGSGHVNPIAAINPGLVYETTKEDLTGFLCNLKGSAGKLVKCNGTENKILPRNLNYPSMSAKVNKDASFNLDFSRTLTNVGTPKATYKATVSKGKGASKFDVKVEPNVLTFKSKDEKKSFIVTVSGEGVKVNQTISSSLVWSDGVHTVRSPIVIYTFSKE